MRPAARLGRRRAPRLTGLAAACLATCAATLSLVPAQAAADTVYKRLSDLRTLSRWAYPNAEATVRSAPSPHAHATAHLRLLTVDEQAELYVALTAAHTGSGETWVKVELPGRPNGHTGWVPRDALGPLHVVRGHLLVD